MHFTGIKAEDGLLDVSCESNTNVYRQRLLIIQLMNHICLKYIYLLVIKCCSSMKCFFYFTYFFTINEIFML